MTRVPFLALTPLALLAACGSAADPEAVIETVRATEQAQLQAMTTGDLRGAVRNYADGAILLTPGRPAATDGEAIAAAVDALLSDPNFSIVMTPGSAWAAESGELAVTTATGRVTATDAESGQAFEVPVINQIVWRRATGKPWMIVSEYNIALPEGMDASG